MTAELVKVLAADMDDALKSNDPGRIMSVVARQSNAMIDCQMKMSDRMKTLVQKQDGIDLRSASCVEVAKKVEELEHWRISIENQVKGAQRVMKLVYALYGAGGSAAVIAFIKWLGGGGASALGG